MSAVALGTIVGIANGYVDTLDGNGPSSGGGGGGTDLSVVDTPTIQLALSDAGVLTANVVIDTDVDLTADSDTHIASQHAIKTYVQNLIAGTGNRGDVRVATTVNIAIATALITGQVIDGITLAAGDRVLVWNQTLKKNNGIYIAADVTPVRATDADTMAEIAGALIIAQEGTAGAGSLWFNSNHATDVLNTDEINYTPISFAGTNLAVDTITATTLKVSSSTGGDATLPSATVTDAGLMSAADKTKLNGIASGAQVNVATDLTVNTRTGTTLNVASSTGADATVPAATTSLAGLMIATDKVKLDGLSALGDLVINLSLDNFTADTFDVIPSGGGTSVTLPKATGVDAGLMSAADKTKLDGIADSADPFVGTNVGMGTRTTTAVPITSSTGTGVTLPEADATHAGMLSAAKWTIIDNLTAPPDTNLSFGTIDSETIALLSSTGTDVTFPKVTSSLAGLMTAADKVILDGLASTGGVNNGLALDVVGASTISLKTTSTSSDEATLPAATGSLAGLMTAADKTKLTGIASGAQVNVATNLTKSPSATGVDLHSSTENNGGISLLPATASAGTNLAGLLTPAQFDKLAALLSAAYLDVDTDGALSANSDSKIATQKAVKTYADSLIAANNAMVFKGVQDCSGNPNYPSAVVGWTYRVSVAGKIGGASGIVVEVGDMYICITNNAGGTQASVGTSWTVVQANLDGAVIGPASSTSGNLASFSGTTGKVIQDSGLSLDTDGTLAANSATKIPSQSAVKTYADTKIASTYLDTDGALSANSDVKIASQKATKTYIDTQIGLLGIPGAVAVRAATTANVTISTALNNGDTIDGVTLVTGDAVVVWKQTSGSENGIYIVGVSPARATQYATFNSHPGILVSVEEGTLYGDKLLYCSSDRGGTINSTTITFARTTALLDFDTNTALGSSDVKVPTQNAVKTYVDAVRPTECIIIAVGDESTAITTGTAKVTFRMPYAFTLTDVRASLTVVSSSGLPTVNVKETGTTIFSTKVTIDANELTSTTAATPMVLSDTSLADDAQMTIDIDVAGTGAAGLKVYLIGHRT